VEVEDQLEDAGCRDHRDLQEDREGKDCQEELEVLGQLEKREDLDGSIVKMT